MFKETKVEKIPVKAKIGGVSRGGKMSIEFNQRMLIPDFIKQDPDPEQGRALTKKISLSEIDVSSLMKFNFISQDEDVDLSKLTFFLDIEKWTDREIMLNINFTNPLEISNGVSEDIVVCILNNRKMFISAESGEPLDSGHKVISKTFPRQLPKSVKEEDIVEDAKTTSTSMGVFILIRIAVQLLFKGSMDDLWGLFFTMQIICYLSIYDVQVPSNSAIYIDEFTSIIEFDMLDPDKLLESFGSDFTIKGILFGD